MNNILPGRHIYFMPNKSIKKNFILNTILTGSNILFPLMTFPFLSRVLLADGNGKVDFATSVISYLIMFSALGIPTYGIRACSQVRDNKEKLSKIVIELFSINFIMTFFMYCIFIIMLFTIPKFYAEKDLLLICSCNLLLNSLGMHWLYSALEEYEYITLRSILFKGISLLAIFFLLKTPEDYKIYAVILVFATSGSNIVNFINAKKYIIFLKIKYNFKKHFKPIIYFFSTAVAISIYTHLDIVMLGFISGDAEVGYYSMAIKIRNALLTAAVSLGTVLLPRLAYWIEKKEYDKFKELIVKSFQFMFFITVGFCIYFIYETPQVIYIFAGKEYCPAIAATRWIIPTTFFAGLSNITGIQCLVPLGKENKLLISIICGAIVNFILNIIFISNYRSAGAAFATLIAEVMVLIIQCIYMRDFLKEIRLIRYNVITLVSGGIALVGTHLFLSGLNLNAVSHIFLSAVVFWMGYICILIVFKYELLFEAILRIKQFLIERGK